MNNPNIKTSGELSKHPQDDDFVTVHYIGKYENGIIFDSTYHKGPLEFQIGKKKVMRAFEEAIKKMTVGEKRTITLNPSEAFGERNPNLVQEVPREIVEKRARIFLGNIIHLQVPYMPKSVPARIIYFDDKIVTLDLNSPMAGKKVIFEIELLKIERDGVCIRK